LKVGKIVGAPVAGTCTFVWWERLQDPALTFGIPNIGIKVADGSYLENSQLQPDILVLNEPAAVAAGADQQLEVAVADLLATLDETKPNP